MPAPPARPNPGPARAWRRCERSAGRFRYTTTSRSAGATAAGSRRRATSSPTCAAPRPAGPPDGAATTAPAAEPEERPRRSFNLHARRPFDQLDEEEREVVARAAAETHRAQPRRGLEFRHHFVSLDLPSDRGQGDYGLTALADLDRDGDLDFVCGGRIPRPERLYWFEYRGPDDWVRHGVGTDYQSDVGRATLDVDGDGLVDLVCSGVWYRNPAKP